MYKPAKYQEAYYQLAGIDSSQIEITDPEVNYECDGIYVTLRDWTDPIEGSCIRLHHPGARAGIRRILERAGVTAPEQPRKLYVSRTDARGFRVCLNEAEAIERAQKRGYEIVNASVLSPVQALHVYGSASVIAGPLGAGLYNFHLAPPGCQIVSFQGRAYFEDAIEQISHLIGHDYAYLGCDHFDSSDKPEGGVRNGNFIVDCEEFERLLDLAEQRAERKWRGERKT